MKSVYRLHQDGVDSNGDRQPRTFWVGDSYPSSNDIENALTQIGHNEERESFYQGRNDYILIQQKRLIGWQTLYSISILNHLSES